MPRSVRNTPSGFPERILSLPAPAKRSSLQRLISLSDGLQPLKTDPDDLDAFPFPAADLQRRIPFAALLTSTGCPFSCAYCASGYLNSRRRLRSPDRIVEEIRFWNSRYGVRDMVFYDDALLVDSECHAIPLFEKIIACGLGKTVRFHTPNAVHIREITQHNRPAHGGSGISDSPARP